MTPRESSAASDERLSAITPGRRLSTARQERNISLQEIAEALNLSVDKIKALEQDEYDAFAGRTYARGYLLGYARYVMVDETEIDADFAALQPSTAHSHTAFKSLDIDPQASISAKYLFIALLVVGLIGGLGLIGYYTLVEKPTSIRGDELLVDSALATPGQGHSDTAQNPPLSQQMGPMPQNVASGDGVSTIIASTQTSTLTTAIPEQQTPAVDPATPAAVNIFLQFTEESWADIRATDGTKLLYNLQPAGSDKTLSVALPIKVFLGNANGVKIFYNGAPYDHPVRGRVAQFTLDYLAAD